MGINNVIHFLIIGVWSYTYLLGKHGENSLKNDKGRFAYHMLITELNSCMKCDQAGLTNKVIYSAQLTQLAPFTSHKSA